MEKLSLIPTLGNNEPIIEELNINDFYIDPEIEVPEPTPILSIIEDGGEEIPIFTEENISLLFGPAKSRKSTFIKSICQAIIKGSNNKMFSNYYRNDVSIIDTEQDRYRCYKTTRVLKFLTGHNMKYYSVVGTSKELKRNLVERHLEENPNCGFLILDNIVHFLRDFNSVDESADLTEWLLKIKNDYRVHILVIIHENGSVGGNIKPRGHLGTNLLNLCETIIRIVKDEDDKTHSVVSAFLTRGKDFKDFMITQDYQGVPFLSEMKEGSNNKGKRF